MLSASMLSSTTAQFQIFLTVVNGLSALDLYEIYLSGMTLETIITEVLIVSRSLPARMECLLDFLSIRRGRLLKSTRLEVATTLSQMTLLIFGDIIAG